MRAIQRLTEVLERKLGKEIPPHEVGYETLSFTHEEIDEELVPPYMIAFVEAPILCHSANYTDIEGNYFTLMLIETGGEKLYEVWLVNDKLVPNFNS
ncbi:hypothetical protein [Lysinibacillus capsici]|uniref:hypothetical protein n=1 Tax=Lysinibacillus capsici TaxID=2115968 RepID=UPI000E1FCA60|nr:hypothetical protein [Lysinibacillus capsici]RDV33832.1 hypothetical protein C7B89_04500 [Lysinibacillus capsici]